VRDNGPRGIFDKNLLDLPDDLLTSANVRLLRLLLNEFLDHWTTIVRVIALRLAGVVLNEIDVRVIDA
jgi:hypothetical protein